ncbi:MAG TPA: cytochrome c oxidase assembly protein [Thermoleophilaceae bacterium]|nr:cytochrome c oxidase assembly protein [Thermoleophilaceae bacterium]
MAFSFDPAVIMLLLGATALYVRAIRILRRRGHSVSRAQQAAWHAGVGLTAVALLGPFDRYGEELMSAHMAQHLLVADLAAPLLLIGLRTPVLLFWLPRPALVALARSRLRGVFRSLRRPLPAVAVYVAVLYGWHAPALFEGALGNDLLHALQHESFVFASLLVWWPALEPKRRRLRGELWKAGHIIGARFSGMFLGMFFVIAGSVLYSGWYGEGERALGLSPLLDQQIAGGLMLLVDAVTMFVALGFFFWRSAQDHDIAEARERAAVAR